MDEKSVAPGDVKQNPPRTLIYTRWIPYLVAASLMALGIGLGMKVAVLKRELAVSTNDADHLRRSNALLGLHLELLEAKDPTYASSRVMIAWDPNENQGVISVDALPPAPAGRDYQLWVLDPNQLTPVNAGLVAGGRPFHTAAITIDHPGFALSLEPAGGSAVLTGNVLFAIAPGPE
jgi:hypothetical protein